MNVACNSPDTVSHRAFISLELQRLRMLLKVHSIELHAKLLRGCALARTWARWHARGPDTSHAGPTLRAWARYLARGPGGMRVGPMVCVWAAPWRISRVGVSVAGLTRIVSGSRASDAPGGAVASTTQVISPTTPHCQRVSSRWLATWAALPRTASSPTVNGGSCASRGPVRDVLADDCAIKRGELHH